ncbi:hypothetical protein ABPG72_015857 [Tetrahymena utriculariae]
MERADRRYKFEHNWAKGFYYFTFGEYYNPRKMGVGRIKAVNEYYLNPQEEFGKNILHKNFDIITIVMNGSLRHNSSVKERVLIEKGQCHLLRIGPKEIKHGIQNVDQNIQGQIFEFWIQNDNIFQNEEGEQTTYQFDVVRKQLNTVQTFIQNDNFELSICHLDKNNNITIQNESLKNIFILNLNGPALLNENIKLNDRDAFTEICASYNLKSAESCITLIILKAI